VQLPHGLPRRLVAVLPHARHSPILMQSDMLSTGECWCMPEAKKAHVLRLACSLDTEQVGLLTLHVQAYSAHTLLRRRLRALAPTACESAQHNDLVNTRLTFTKHATLKTVSPLWSRCKSVGEQPGRAYASWQAQAACTAAGCRCLESGEQAVHQAVRAPRTRRQS